MFLNSGFALKFMRLECFVCGESEYADFSVIRPDIYDSKDGDFLIVEFNSENNEKFLDRLRMLRNFKKFNKTVVDPEEVFIELNLTKSQMEDTRDAIFDATAEYDFDDFEDKFDAHLQKLQDVNFKTFKTGAEQMEWLLFKSSDGLQLRIEENPDFFTDPFRLSYSVNDGAFLKREEKKRELLNYLFKKDWKSPFSQAYFSLSWDETIQLLASISFALNEKNIEQYFMMEDDEDDDEGMGEDA